MVELKRRAFCKECKDDPKIRHITSEQVCPLVVALQVCRAVP